MISNLIIILISILLYRRINESSPQIDLTIAIIRFSNNPGSVLAGLHSQLLSSIELADQKHFLISKKTIVITKHVQTECQPVKTRLND